MQLLLQLVPDAFPSVFNRLFLAAALRYQNSRGQLRTTSIASVKRGNTCVAETGPNSIGSKVNTWPVQT
jgi:hypothetical protein